MVFFFFFFFFFLAGITLECILLRQTSGLAGFPKRDESVHDAFGAGHSSTSISAALGMAVARELLGRRTVSFL